MPSAITIFDSRLHQMRKARAARRYHDSNFLVKEAASRLMDCLDDVTRDFPLALDLGCHAGELAAEGSSRIGRLIQYDMPSPRLAQLDGTAGTVIGGSPEALPFAENSIDLVLSAMALHWVNDLPGVLAQIRHILKPDGLFLAIFPGGDTLHELRHSLADTDSRMQGGISPRVIPFIDIRDAGSLLQRAGFALPVIDSDRIDVSYATLFDLIRDLRGMGSTNTLLERNKTFLPRTYFTQAAAYYAEHFPAKGDPHKINATVDLITMAAWKPADSQPKPAQRGSGQMSLKQALN